MNRSYHRGVENVGVLQGQLRLPLRGLNISPIKGISLYVPGNA